MKKYKEIILDYNKFKNEKILVEKIDELASDLYKDGWFFENSKIDSTFEKIYLFFYKNL